MQMPVTSHTVVTAEPSSTARPDHFTLLAFAAVAILGGANAVAIKVGFAELAPFWAAAIRFLAAAVILFAVMAVMRLSLPSGRALTGVVLYGILAFGLAYFFAYWALQEVSAGTAMVILATVPLLTSILAIAQRVEKFRMRGLVGAVIAALGIVFIFWNEIAFASPAALIAVFAGAVCIAQAPVTVKRFPRVHPVVENALGMAVGGLMLLVVSLFAGEPRAIPAGLPTQLSLLYLIVGGSIGLFVLYLFMLSRWTASGSSYVMLIMPLVTIVLAALILGETATWIFVLGGVAVLAGVYIGALRTHPEKNAAPAKEGT
jgi:drug/metabolite transporter (DMT)-like permease